jgi:pimeloyl-ACP methyl ester carboxylesterase
MLNNSGGWGSNRKDVGKETRFGVRSSGRKREEKSSLQRCGFNGKVKKKASICLTMPTRHTVPVDGDEVVAVHHRPDADSDGWLFFSHGFVSDKEGSYVGRCERAAAEGYNTVRFDHRGCGESDLSFGEQNLSTRVADLRAVIDYFDPPSSVLFGSSFGGKAVFHVGIDEPSVEAIGTRAPVTYTEPFEKYRQEVGSGGDTGSGWGAVADDFFEDLSSYGFGEVKDELDVPVVVFHGRDDATVRVEQSFDAVAALETDASLHAYADEGHSFSRGAEARLRDTFFSWLETTVFPE